MATFSNGVSVGVATESAQDRNDFSGANEKNEILLVPAGSYYDVTILIGQVNGIGLVNNTQNGIRIYDATNTVILHSFNQNNTVTHNIKVGPGQRISDFKIGGSTTVLSYRVYGVQIKNGM